MIKHIVEQIIKDNNDILVDTLRGAMSRQKLIYKRNKILTFIKNHVGCEVVLKSKQWNINIKGFIGYTDYGNYLAIFTDKNHGTLPTNYSLEMFSDIICYVVLDRRDTYNANKIWIVKKYSNYSYYVNQVCNGYRVYNQDVRLTKQDMLNIGGVL